MKTLLLILATLVCIAEDRTCYVWHFDNKGHMLFIDTVSSVYRGPGFKYHVIGEDSTLYFSYTKNKKLKKSNLSIADVVEP